MSFSTSELSKKILEELSEQPSFTGSYCSEESKLIIIFFDDFSIQISNNYNFQVIKKCVGPIYSFTFESRLDIDTISSDMIQLSFMFFY